MHLGRTKGEPTSQVGALKPGGSGCGLSPPATLSRSASLSSEVFADLFPFGSAAALISGLAVTDVFDLEMPHPPSAAGLA